MIGDIATGVPIINYQIKRGLTAQQIVECSKVRTISCLKIPKTVEVLNDIAKLEREERPQKWDRGFGTFWGYLLVIIIELG